MLPYRSILDPATNIKVCFMLVTGGNPNVCFFPVNTCMVSLRMSLCSNIYESVKDLASKALFHYILNDP